VPPTRLEGDPTATLLRGAVYGEYRPDPRFTIAAAGRGQYSGNPLFSFEEYSAGNYTVGRGYDPGAILGDSGLGFQAELRYGTLFPRDPEAFTVEPFVFVDQAWVWNEDLILAVGDEELTSVGGGLRAAWGDRLRLELMLARRSTAPLPARSRPAPAGHSYHAPVAMELAMNAHSPCPPMIRWDASAQTAQPAVQLRDRQRACSATQARAGEGAGVPRRPDHVAGGVSYDRATPGVETITIDTDSAIINWEPTVPGNPIPFLPAAMSRPSRMGPATTTSSSSTGLKRSTGPLRRHRARPAPGRRQRHAGRHHPLLQPGGIIVGASALFDVGSLVLTT
jgi:hypothetical protein